LEKERPLLGQNVQLAVPDLVGDNPQAEETVGVAEVETEVADQVVAALAVLPSVTSATPVNE
jgi:hypothetical protein